MFAYVQYCGVSSLSVTQDECKKQFNLFALLQVQTLLLRALRYYIDNYIRCYDVISVLYTHSMGNGP